MHGGKSTGAPKGNRNAWRHGNYSSVETSPDAFVAEGLGGNGDRSVIAGVDWGIVLLAALAFIALWLLWKHQDRSRAQRERGERMPRDAAEEEAAYWERKANEIGKQE